MPIFNRRENEVLEEALRIRERELREIEEKAAEQDETIQNLNRILDQQDRALYALRELTTLLTNVNVRDVADQIVEMALKAMRCEAGTLALRDESGKQLCIFGVVGDRSEALRRQSFDLGEGIIGSVAKSGEPLMIPDARREPRLRKEGPDFIQRESRNALCVPIPGSGRPWGAMLLLNTKDRKRFNKQDMDLLVVMTLRLTQELDREAESGHAKGEAARFSTLLRISEILHGAKDADKMRELLIPLALRMVQAQGAAFFMMDETSGTLTCSVSSEKAGKLIQIPLGMGVAGWVALQGQTVNVNIDEDQRFAGQFEPIFQFRVRNVLSVPVRGAGRTLGVLEVVNKSGVRGFDETDANLLSVLAREAGMSLDNLQHLQESQRTIQELLRGLARYIDAKAPYLMGHSERVARLSQVIGEELGMQPEELQRLYLEGLLHDLGNVGVDDELLLRTSSLSEEEINRIKHHSAIGGEILGDVAALRSLMAGPMYHHERWDGNGYPQGLKGEQIPLHARIVGVAEAFDALRSSRPYREAISPGEALVKIRESSEVMFDPRVINALTSAFQRGKIQA